MSIKIGVVVVIERSIIAATITSSFVDPFD
jgi:hypothetical protein